MIKRFRKSLFFSRIRQFFPMEEYAYTDDRARLDNSHAISIDWPLQVKKPKVGIVQDLGKFPSWTKYAQFLENNSFDYDIYNIHDQDWLEKAKNFDVVIGITSNTSFHLDEIREKYYILETCLGKVCYPSVQHTVLYENKKLETYFSKIFGIPFANTYISCDKKDAYKLIENIKYPVISKVIPSAGSVGVEMIHTKEQARKIVKQAFSTIGRKIHIVYARQKNYIYFQDYIPNDGYDIRVIVVGNRVFGFYRRTMRGDFRASGFHLEEKKDLPEEAMKIARQVNRIINSPLLVVDMIFGLDEKYYINEFSPICQMSTLDQLQVNGVSGAYVFEDNDTYYFEPGSYWVHELALKEFFLNHYVPGFSNSEKKNEKIRAQ